ncbi:MAG: hypothetical protein BWY67_02156 [Bacteroidetes bacterium ADurb.Bin397]|nr:MAG: hypothetical protein BWY67_02156 [Bacteroidetes bacterium ADurb.Bin397]
MVKLAVMNFTSESWPSGWRVDNFVGLSNSFLAMRVVLKYCCLKATHLTLVGNVSSSSLVSERYSASSAVYL